ncbi:hypothetical protein [Adhaeribacter aquaticus]|uniref:hypothetical protein n=1 Tax=Adhaeribacter aquaticus TaxID=299567 RepID=UPI0012FAADF1|nr:hypothetical protein [Adhaeribacter aquaticus]
MRRISAKRRKDLYSLSSLLFHLLVFIVLLISLGTDSNDDNTAKNKAESAKQDGTKPSGTFFVSIAN